MQKVYAKVVYYFLYRENDGIVSLLGCSYALANGGGDLEWSCFCPAAQYFTTFSINFSTYSTTQAQRHECS